MATTKKTKATERVRVRMYRQGLGDCFLITIPTGKARPFYMMIMLLGVITLLSVTAVVIEKMYIP